MKIAILTLPLHTNYGGILQAYALQTVLKRMGHNVTVLQKNPDISYPKCVMPFVYFKRILYKIFKNKNIVIDIEKIRKKERSIVQRNTDSFIKKYINLEIVNTLKDISPKQYDAIIVGSDQIWRKPYFCGNWYAPIEDAFLKFTNDWNIKRIAYAASFGISDISKEYTQKNIINCGSLLKLFNAVSVREYDAIDICKNKFRRNAKLVLDPTMLLPKTDYIQIINESTTPKSMGNLFCYLLDSSEFKTKIISKIASDNNLNPFYVGVDTSDRSLPINERIQPHVETWLRGFVDAKFIVTDSFHACVFAIIFNKPFIVIENKYRGNSRIKSLLEFTGLKHHLIQEGDELYMTKDLTLRLNFNKINKLHKESIDFLEQSLNVDNNETI